MLGAISMSTPSAYLLPHRRPLLILVLLALAFSLGSAQEMPLRGEDPAALADEAVESWRTRTPLSLTELSGLDTEEVCRQLPTLLAAPPPPEGTRVNVEDRREREAEDPDGRRYTYSAVRPGDRLDVVEVLLQRDGEVWEVERVGFQMPDVGNRDWLQRPATSIAFGVLSLLFVYGLARPSFLRGWLRAGLRSVRQHRRLVAWTLGGLYALSLLGMYGGSTLPAACETGVRALLLQTLEGVGATEAIASGNLARAATVIFYQNFVVVTVTALFGSAVLLGIPAYLLASFSFFAQSAAFGLLWSGGAAEFVLTGLLVVLEFTAYFLVVAGGGMLVATLLRHGFEGLGAGYRKLLSMLPLAALLLLIGAWYEALIVVGF